MSPRDNPPKRPRNRPGLSWHWVRPVKKRGRRLRRGHWRRQRVAITSPAARWESAWAFERRLIEEENIASADPIYRFNWKSDVVRSRTNPETDPLHGLVWGSPTARFPKAAFDGGRVWYIVEFPQEEVSRLYVRTVREFPIKPRGMMQAAATIEKLRDAVRKIYEEKDATGEYERLGRFVAWTVFERSQAGDVARIHKVQRGRLSRGAGVSLDTRRGFKVVRQPTAWEKFSIYEADRRDALKERRAGKTRRGRSIFVPPRFTGPNQFQAWLKRQTPTRRRDILAYFQEQVRLRAREIERRRKRK